MWIKRKDRTRVRYFVFILRQLREQLPNLYAGTYRTSNRVDRNKNTHKSCNITPHTLHINEKKYGQEGSLCIEKKFFIMEGS